MKKQVCTTAVSIAFGLALATATAWAEQSNIQVSAGVVYTSGTFGGTEEIEELYVPISASIDAGRLGFKLVVPYLRVTEPGVSGITTESGLGDVVASITVYDVYYSRDLGLALDLSGSAKFGTADEAKGLGTGEPDYSIYLDGYKFFENVTLLGSMGYRWRGETVDNLVDDVFIGSAGAVFLVSSETLLGLVYDYRESALLDADDIQELTGFISFELNDDWRAELSAFAGFTDSSPDWGGGVAVSTDLRRFRLRDGR